MSAAAYASVIDGLRRVPTKTYLWRICSPSERASKRLATQSFPCPASVGIRKDCGASVHARTRLLHVLLFLFVCLSGNIRWTPNRTALELVLCDLGDRMRADRCLVRTISACIYVIPLTRSTRSVVTPCCILDCQFGELVWWLVHACPLGVILNLICW